MRAMVLAVIAVLMIGITACGGKTPNHKIVVDVIDKDGRGRDGAVVRLYGPMSTEPGYEPEVDLWGVTDMSGEYVFDIQLPKEGTMAVMTYYKKPVTTEDHPPIADSQDRKMLQLEDDKYDYTVKLMLP